MEFEIRTWDVVHLQKLNQCAKNNFPCFLFDYIFELFLQVENKKFGVMEGLTQNLQVYTEMFMRKKLFLFIILGNEDL